MAVSDPPPIHPCRSPNQLAQASVKGSSVPVVVAVATSNTAAAADDGGTYVTPSFDLPGGMLDGTSAGEEKNAGVSVMATNWAR